jgi:hypothetical protein
VKYVLDSVKPVCVYVKFLKRGIFVITEKPRVVFANMLFLTLFPVKK